MNEMDFFDQDKPIDTVSLGQLNQLGQLIFDQKKVVDEIDEALTNAKALLHKLQAKMLAILDQFGHSNFSIPGCGMLIKSERLTVTLPKTPEEKEAFYNYLKRREIFDELVTVNSMTLNAFYKKEFEIAAEEGRAGQFKIPGISEPKVISTLNMRKGKV